MSENCSLGEFLKNSEWGCTACRICSDYNRVVKEVCSTITDTVCGACKPGFEDTVSNRIHYDDGTSILDSCTLAKVVLAPPFVPSWELIAGICVAVVAGVFLFLGILGIICRKRLRRHLHNVCCCIQFSKQVVSETLQECEPLDAESQNGTTEVESQNDTTEAESQNGTTNAEPQDAATEV